MEPLDISPETLKRHANYTRQDAAEIAETNSTAGSMNLSGGAFGLMCSGLVPRAEGVSNSAQRLLQEAKHMLERNSDALTKTAAEFAEADEEYASTFNQTETGDSISGACNE